MSIKNGGGDEKQKPRVLIKPRIPQAAKPAPDDIQTRVEKSDKDLPHTVRPPRPPPASEPISIRTGSHEHITGEEQTEAAAIPEKPAVVPSRPPPPPAKPKTKLPEVAVACDRVLKDERPSITMRNKSDALAKLYDDQFQIDPKNPQVRNLIAGAQRHSEELDLVAAHLGNDKKKLMTAQETARQKWDGGQKLERIEDKIIELIHTKKAIEGFNSDDKEKLDLFDAYVKKKFQVTGSLNPLEKYLYELQRLKTEAMRVKAEADEYDRINSMRSSRRYSERYDKDKSPKGTARPSVEKSHRIQKPDDPAFVASDEGKRISVPPEEAERRSSRPPASTTYRGKEPGPIRRTLSDPMFWTIGGLAGFTYALVYKDSFREMARGLRVIWRDVLHRHDFEFTKVHTMAGYAGIMAIGLALTILLRRRAVRKMAMRYQELNEGSSKEHERKERVIAKLAKISYEHDKFEDQVTNLRQAMLKDVQFMADLYELKKHKFFNDMLSEAKLHPKLMQKLDIVFESVKVEKLQKKLNKLAELLYNPGQRCDTFREYYDNDPIFQMTIDEIFERRGGNYVNTDKQNAAFHEILNDDNENVGPQLRKALGEDFESFRN